ncbi:MAG: 4Fe-4S dicluster domain-containing protein [Clostridiales Family XIII bacterium]|jgi:ferredoxin|nr:4Fe-4S dicluster domain-containing protein [Clostridiales Family XIII bacterium]
MTNTEKIVLNSALCKSCGLCVKHCPKGALKLSGKWNKKGYDYVEIEEADCIKCQTCYVVCPEIVFTFE